MLHGNEQDVLLYPERSSPTVSVHVIMTCLAIAACNTLYTLGKTDVKGAFIQTDMSGTPVYVKCTGKVLYSCVQASKLWYEKLQNFLRTQGYKSCDVDPCVFKRVVEGKVYLLLIYICRWHTDSG